MTDRIIAVSVTDEEQAFIEEQLASGRYADESEVLRAGLGRLEHEAKVATLRAMVAEADDQFDAGDYVTFDSAEAATAFIVEQAAARR
jgi:antitoxin ParD1/3/4